MQIAIYRLRLFQNPVSFGIGSIVNENLAIDEN
jgi:hypothetical protein